MTSFSVTQEIIVKTESSVRALSLREYLEIILFLFSQGVRYKAKSCDSSTKRSSTKLNTNMSSNPQRIQQHLENRGGSSESLVFDPATGKLMVKPKQEAQNSDRTVMLDMNKSGSGGFFNVGACDLQQKSKGDSTVRSSTPR